MAGSKPMPLTESLESLKPLLWAACPRNDGDEWVVGIVRIGNEYLLDLDLQDAPVQIRDTLRIDGDCRWGLILKDDVFSLAKRIMSHPGARRLQVNGGAYEYEDYNPPNPGHIGHASKVLAEALGGKGVPSEWTRTTEVKPLFHAGASSGKWYTAILELNGQYILTSDQNEDFNEKCEGGSEWLKLPTDDYWSIIPKTFVLPFAQGVLELPAVKTSVPRQLQALRASLYPPPDIQEFSF